MLTILVAVISFIRGAIFGTILMIYAWWQEKGTGMKIIVRPDGTGTLITDEEGGKE